jgi:hypothetical protein
VRGEVRYAESFEGLPALEVLAAAQVSTGGRLGFSGFTWEKARPFFRCQVKALPVSDARERPS